MSRIGMLRVSTFKHKNPWPDPQLSIGESWCEIGKTRCWEAVGPAQEVAGKILRHIKDLLESQHEHLNEGVCVPRALLFGLYMIGRAIEQARPTIIFSCENKAQRQRAMKVVRGSLLLDAYPAVLLAESSRPPRLSREPQQLGDICWDYDVQMPPAPETSTLSNRLVYYSHPQSSSHGIPVIIKSTEESLTSRKCTLGIVRIGDKLFGITVAHAFVDPPENNHPGEGGDLEFSLEHDSDDEDNEDENFIDATSRGSASPEQFTVDYTKSPDSFNSIISELDVEIQTLPSIAANQEIKLSKKYATKEPLQFLGRVAAMSRSTATSNLDWAVIHLECVDPFSWINTVKSFPPVQSIAYTLSETKKVQVVTASNGTIDGKITGTPTFMQVPQSIAFQEVWVVQLDGPLRRGDCGSWVIDPDKGTLFGYVTAGDPETSIAYIIPAYQAFHEIEQQMGAEVTFPPFDSVDHRIRILFNNRMRREENLRNSLRATLTSEFPDDASKNNVANMYTECRAAISRAAEDSLVLLEDNDSLAQAGPRIPKGGSADTTTSRETLSQWMSGQGSICNEPSLQSIDTTRLNPSASFHPANSSRVDDFKIDKDFFHYGSDEYAMNQNKSSQSVRPSGSRYSLKEVASSKHSYQRPKHNRVYCKECDGHPDGFRGEHELRRHQDRQHRKMVKKWICIQPPGSEHPTPAQPLSRCKACTQQKKKYGAYYNAAAHLRRAHFRPKSMGRERKVDEANKRGGKAGGDWPPMSELKHWMMEVDELVTDYSSAASLEEDALEEEEIEETSLSTVNDVTGGDYDTDPFIHDATFYGSSSLTNSELFSMPNMQFVDLAQHPQQSINSSIAGSQDGFEDFSFSKENHYTSGMADVAAQHPQQSIDSSIAGSQDGFEYLSFSQENHYTSGMADVAATSREEAA
ncbi:hypothetical protein OIDMADRAFT_59318 [Oidiodendron maius Zn]|uniref:DUF7896 domain-containing protein n=1 Tax=Oidiodendron maius (strain Zn) TaxID=913774 RepID=A0A0C3GYK1_OIDMZ|nr:hypothetical protein OIDMADRAFT_59318 [Oidiodendron maius Zn]